MNFGWEFLFLYVGTTIFLWYISILILIVFTRIEIKIYARNHFKKTERYRNELQ